MMRMPDQSCAGGNARSGHYILCVGFWSDMASQMLWRNPLLPLLPIIPKPSMVRNNIIVTLEIFMHVHVLCLNKLTLAQYLFYFLTDDTCIIDRKERDKKKVTLM